jgi:hypothetical protein
MRVRKKAHEKTPKRKDRRDGPEKPAGGKFAPIIEELGKMKTRLESGAVSFTPRPLSLQEKTQQEIEGELIHREETVREDFGTVFRDNPQALVEFMAAMRKYGDDEVLRDLVFAAETLYGGEVERMPGGLQFWEELKKEVGTIPYEPGADADDERLHRILAVEILREAALSYDIISSEMEEEEAPQQEDNEIAPGEEGPGAHPGTLPATAIEMPPPELSEPEVPQPTGVAEGRIHAQLDIMAKKDADIRQALVELHRREATIQKEMERLHKISLESIDTEEKLKLEREELVQREERLLGHEELFGEKENALLASEQEALARVAGHEEERRQLMARVQDITAALEETRSLHARTEQDLVALRKEAEEGRKASEESRQKDEALSEQSRKLEVERARLEDLKGRFEAEQARLKKLEEELAQRSSMQVELEAQQLRLRELEGELASKGQILSELDIKQRRLRVMEDETIAIRARVGLREKELAEIEETLKEEAGRWERDLGAREDNLAAREGALKEMDGRLGERARALEEAERVLEEQRRTLTNLAGELAARESDIAQTRKAGPPVAPAPVKATPPATPAPLPPAPAAAVKMAAPQAPARPQPVPSGKAQSSLAPPPSPPLVPLRKEPPSIPPPEPAGEPKPVFKVKCPGCKNLIPVSSTQRPLRIRCTKCGKEGVLK